MQAGDARHQSPELLVAGKALLGHAFGGSSQQYEGGQEALWSTALEAEFRCHLRPAVADCPEHHLVGYMGVVEDHLVEVVGAIHGDDRPGLDPRPA